MSVTVEFGTGSVRARRAGNGRHLRLVVPGEAGGGATGAGPRAGSASTGGVRLTPRGRRVVAALGLLAVLASAWAVLAQVAAGPLDARVGDYSGATTQVVVLPGDTLWGIARTAQPDADPRDTVLHIQQLNGLSDSAVPAGQRLVVPAGG